MKSYEIFNPYGTPGSLFIDKKFGNLHDINWKNIRTWFKLIIFNSSNQTPNGLLDFRVFIFCSCVPDDSPTRTKLSRDHWGGGFSLEYGGPRDCLDMTSVEHGRGFGALLWKYNTFKNAVFNVRISVSRIFRNVFFNRRKV